jgi:light-regulated signal transduction histidine kinase (bacteriophytochrome)
MKTGSEAMFEAMFGLEWATAGHWKVTVQKREDGLMEAKVKATAYRLAYADALLYRSEDLAQLVTADVLAHRFAQRIDEVRRAIDRHAVATVEATIQANIHEILGARPKVSYEEACKFGSPFSPKGDP